MPNDFLGAKRLYMSVSRDGRSIEFHGGGGENVDEPEHLALEQLVKEAESFVMRLLHPKVTSICVTRCSITDTLIKSIAEACRKLKELNVSSCCELTDESIKAIAERCPQLKELNVSRCCNLTDESIKAIATHCRGLKELNVSRCNELTNESIKAIATGCPGLKKLNVSYITKCEDESIIQIAIGCPKLMNLNVQGTNLTVKSIEAIVRHCHGITSLNVQNKNLANESIKAISKGCVKLAGLNISCCQELKDESIKEVANHCSELKELNVSHCQELTDESIKEVANHCSKLKELNVSHIDKLTDKSIKEVANHCSELKELNVSHIKNLTDESIRAIAKGCPKLNELNLSWCHKLRDESFTAIAIGCTEIKVLNVSHCPRITDESIRAFVKGCVLLNLNASHCDLKSLPNDIGDRLPELQLLNISNNHIKKLPRSVLNLKNLQELVVSDNPLESPPCETANKGMGAIEEFFYDRERGSSASTLLKVVLVGDGESGKTSLRNALARRHEPDVTSRTIRLEIEKIRVTDDLKANVYDCGGWEENLATQLVYLKGLALYIVVVEAQYVPSVDKKVLDDKLHRFLLILQNRNLGAVVLLPIVTKVDTVEKDPQSLCECLDKTIENWLQNTREMCCACDMPLLVPSRALAVSITDTKKIQDVRDRIIELTRSNLPLRRGVGQQILPAYEGILRLFGAIARYGDNNRALEALRDGEAPALGEINHSELSEDGRYRPKVELENLWNEYCNEPHVNVGDVFDDATQLWEAQGLVVVDADLVILQPNFVATLVNPLVKHGQHNIDDNKLELFFNSKPWRGDRNELLNKLRLALQTLSRSGEFETSDESLVLSFLWRHTGLKECHHLQVLKMLARSGVIHKVERDNREGTPFVVVPFLLPQIADETECGDKWRKNVPYPWRELKLRFEARSVFPTGFAERFAANVHGLGMALHSWRSGTVVIIADGKCIARAEDSGEAIEFSVRFKEAGKRAAWKALCNARQLLAAQRAPRFPLLGYAESFLCEKCLRDGRSVSTVAFDPGCTVYYRFSGCNHDFFLDEE